MRHVYRRWQQRGLHVFCFGYRKIRSHQIDCVIGTELPFAAANTELYDVLNIRMIHGPCECGQSTKQYPKSFTSETITSDDGYPYYSQVSPEKMGFIYDICSEMKRLLQ